ncbi:MAG: hypothetical protein LQ349_008329, partial [Xanthoria aureola]
YLERLSRFVVIHLVCRITSRIGDILLSQAQILTSSPSITEERCLGLMYHLNSRHIFLLLTFCLRVHQWTESFGTAAAATTAAPRLRNSHWECFDDPRKFAPVIFRDCIDVINHEVTRRYDPTVPLKFSQDPNLHPDIRLPHFWSRAEHKCGVGIDLASHVHEYDRTTLEDIQTVARAVAVECIIKGPHLGGFTTTGWYQRLGVFIAGPSPRLNRLNGTTGDS